MSDKFKRKSITLPVQALEQLEEIKKLTSIQNNSSAIAISIFNYHKFLISQK